jgi:hypothetical protein
METEILQTLTYFARFSYPLRLKEIYFFLHVPCLRPQVEQSLEQLLTDKKIFRYVESVEKKTYLYTISGNEEFFTTRSEREKISQRKIKKVKKYISFLSKFSEIQLIGLSGSLSMLNAKKKDDIDLFIITYVKKLWTGRFIALMLASLFRMRRKRGQQEASNKICLNLFFDGKNLKIPENKRTEYVAHEILQMKPMFIRAEIYQDFLFHNQWVFDLFPNARQFFTFEKNGKKKKADRVDFLELFLKKLQLFFIKKHKTNELITNDQLWFFPQDFGEKLKENRS